MGDPEVIAIVLQRLAFMEMLLDGGEALLEIDEAVEVLDPMGHPKFKKEKAAAEASVEDVLQYQNEFDELARTMAHPPKPAKRKPLPKLPIGPPTAEVNKFKPPATSVWRGEGDGGKWCGHCPPFRRISVRWSDHGEEQARWSVVAKLWRQHLRKNGLGVAHCPWTDLLAFDVWPGSPS